MVDLKSRYAIKCECGEASANIKTILDGFCDDKPSFEALLECHACKKELVVEDKKELDILIIKDDKY